ncbi:hypothetical protein [Candidatus Berkiella aquae]|uniref:Uncharacterized protein n=1 Tax=Candidatus Berkiella aquae TaxID=295108 RepID=A0A0Q9Z1W3_9GAMM|nr:hypothetical protein [Candidatus Berkiella aquae]MCS5712152.1 hypothetical protein [Candidatus Berkiella aquae]
MATPTQNPAFYKDYTSTEIRKFETILKLIHSPQPNVALAKKMVTDFEDNRELQRFKDFKVSFENALQMSQKNLAQYEQSQKMLKQQETQLQDKKQSLIQQHSQKIGDSIKDRKISSENTHDKSSTQRRLR